MGLKKVPFTKSHIEQLIKKYPAPFYIYDEKGIRETAQEFLKTFSVLPGFINYFAVKATPNPSILKLLKEEGMGLDCSSLAELLLAEKIGVRGEWIMFSSNDTPEQEFKKARELGAIINLDDISHIEFLEKHAGLPDIICLRYNPGSLKKGNAIIGKPEEAKYGMTREHIFAAYTLLKQKGVKRFGLHTMVASNELHSEYFVETAKLLFDLALEIKNKLGITLEFINLGGGIGIPYKPEEQEVDLVAVAQGIKKAYNSVILEQTPIKSGVAIESPTGGPIGRFGSLQDDKKLNIVMECGRVITGSHGYLVSKVLHLKNTYRQYVGLDASMADLMRPGMYGAYHHITVLGKEAEKPTQMYDVTGSLCENNDKFAIQRKLPEVAIDDLLVIHDAGAHGHAMGFQYNGKLRSAEFLLKEDGTFEMIRRAETVDDYFATLQF